MKVQAAHDRIAGAGAHVLVISFAPAAELDGYRERLELAFPIASDPGLAAYRAYGLSRGSVWQVLHPRVFWKYIVLLARGMKLRRAAWGADAFQLGGDFVIDADGVIRFAHRSRRPDDRPDVGQIIDALHRAN